MRARVLVHLTTFVALLGAALPSLAPRSDALAAVPTNPDPWPRTVPITGGSLTIYQPQVDSWDGGFLKLRAAVAVKPGDGGQEVFGVIRASALDQESQARGWGNNQYSSFNNRGYYGDSGFSGGYRGGSFGGWGRASGFSGGFHRFGGGRPDSALPFTELWRRGGIFPRYLKNLTLTNCYN
jgi:hypothetical protein